MEYGVLPKLSLAFTACNDFVTAGTGYMLPAGAAFQPTRAISPSHMTGGPRLCNVSETLRNIYYEGGQSLVWRWRLRQAPREYELHFSARSPTQDDQQIRQRSRVAAEPVPVTLSEEGRQ